MRHATAGCTSHAPVLVLLLCCFAVTVSRAVLFGSATHGGLFDTTNVFLRTQGGGPIQAVRFVNVGWSDPSGEQFQSDLSAVRDAWTINGAVPIINWLPYAYKDWASPTPNELIANGRYDDYVNSFLSLLSSTFINAPKTHARRAYIRFAPSPNGNWFPWSPSCPECSGSGQNIDQTAESYAKMFASVAVRVRAHFNDTDVQVMLDFSTYSPSGNFADFAPAACLVDWVSLTGNNWGTTIPGNQWLSPSQLYSGALEQVENLWGSQGAAKPVALTYAGSVSQPNGIQAKSAWLADLLAMPARVNNASSPGRSCIGMIAYQNEDSQQSDFAFFGGAAGTSQWTTPDGGTTYWAYDVVPAALANATLRFIGPSQRDPRVISDAAFKKGGECTD